MQRSGTRVICASSGTSRARRARASDQNLSKSAGDGLPFLIFSGSNPALNTNGSSRPFLVGGRESRKNPGARNVPETLKTTPVADTSKGMFVNTVVPKLSRTAKGRFDASKFFLPSSLTVNVAVSPQR